MITTKSHKRRTKWVEIAISITDYSKDLSVRKLKLSVKTGRPIGRSERQTPQTEHKERLRTSVGGGVENERCKKEKREKGAEGMCVCVFDDGSFAWGRSNCG